MRCGASPCFTGPSRQNVSFDFDSALLEKVVLPHDGGRALPNKGTYHHVVARGRMANSFLQRRSSQAACGFLENLTNGREHLVSRALPTKTGCHAAVHGKAVPVASLANEAPSQVRQLAHRQIELVVGLGSGCRV